MPMDGPRTQQFSIRECLSTGWRVAFGSNYKALVLGSVLWCVVAIATVAGALLLERLLPCAGLFASTVADPLLHAITVAIVRAMRGGPLRFPLLDGDLAAAFKIILLGLVLRVCVAMIGLGAVVCIVIAFYAGSVGAMMAIWLPLGIAALAACILVRLCFVPLIVMERRDRRSFSDACAKSWDMTDGPIGLRVFALGAVSVCICLLNATLLVLPLVLLGLPLVFASFAAAYEFARPLYTQDATSAGPAAARSHRCDFCGYPREGIAMPRCPECGEAYDEPAAESISSQR